MSCILHESSDMVSGSTNPTSDFAITAPAIHAANSSLSFKTHSGVNSDSALSWIQFSRRCFSDSPFL